MKIIISAVVTILLAFTASSVMAGSPSADLKYARCASASVASIVRESYRADIGEPLAVVARNLEIPEFLVASSLAKENKRIIAATPQRIKDVWKSIDTWGKDTKIRIIMTMGGEHVMDFPSTVPVAQEDLDDGWIDIFANDGFGVRGHLWLDNVDTIAATDIIGKDKKKRTKGISFYANDGTLIVGLYASIAHKTFDEKAVKAFEHTWGVLSALPQRCTEF